jgi:uncharacterized protein YkwD
MFLAACALSAAPASAATDAEAQSAAATVTAASAVPSGWTGNSTGCSTGTESQASIDATLQAVNAFRSVAGLAPVTFDPALNQGALAAALMMRAGNENGNRLGLSHGPDASWTCFSTEGAAAAGRSNLALGSSGAASIRLYVSDDGVDGLGHRRWILDPRAVTFGTGSTGTTNALAVIGGERTTAPSGLRVAWPPAGAIAASWLPTTWSISVGGTDDAVDLAAPQVSMTLDGAPVAVSSVAEAAPGYGTGRTLTWVPAVDRISLRIGTGYHELRTSISGFTVNGAATPITYTTTVGPPPAATAASITSQPVATPAATPAVAPPGLSPTLTHSRGRVRVGTRLVASFRQGTGRIVARLQWLRDGKPIKGAQAVRRRISRADRGHRLRVQVTSQTANGAFRTVELSPVVRVPRR